MQTPSKTPVRIRKCTGAQRRARWAVVAHEEGDQALAIRPPSLGQPWGTPNDDGRNTEELAIGGVH